MKVAILLLLTLTFIFGYSATTSSTKVTEPLPPIVVALPTEMPVIQPAPVKAEETPEEPAQTTSEATAPKDNPVALSAPITPTSSAPLQQEPPAALVVEPSPYATPKIDFDTLNTQVQPAVVNILCSPSQGSPISGATGSGVVIDPRGVILTNAHVAQYVLLSHLPEARISCVVRIGAPAKARYTADVLAFPTAWLEKNAHAIKTESPTGSGEDDWALLYITGRTDGSKRPETYPFIGFDPRHAVAQADERVLLSGYPAGFLGGATLTRDLWPSSAVVSIKSVYTFVSDTLDILSLGGSVVAQGGASGGAVVNEWGKLVGIVVTSSVADTTSERDLRAVTLSHIDASVRKNGDTSLLGILLEGDFERRMQVFQEKSLPRLLGMYSL